MSFICSSNNNIKRITLMLDRLKRTYGDYLCTVRADEEQVETEKTEIGTSTGNPTGISGGYQGRFHVRVEPRASVPHIDPLQIEAALAEEKASQPMSPSPLPVSVSGLESGSLSPSRDNLDSGSLSPSPKKAYAGVSGSGSKIDGEGGTRTPLSALSSSKGAGAAVKVKVKVNNNNGNSTVIHLFQFPALDAMADDNVCTESQLRELGMGYVLNVLIVLILIYSHYLLIFDLSMSMCLSWLSYRRLLSRCALESQYRSSSIYHILQYTISLAQSITNILISIHPHNNTTTT